MTRQGMLGRGGHSVSRAAVTFRFQTGGAAGAARRVSSLELRHGVVPDYEKLGVFYLGREFDPGAADLGPELLYDSRDLTTHAVCIGMTGSGKTGLCLSLLEEAALDGVPAIVDRPQGRPRQPAAHLSGAATGRFRAVGRCRRSRPQGPERRRIRRRRPPRPGARVSPSGTRTASASSGFAQPPSSRSIRRARRRGGRCRSCARSQRRIRGDRGRDARSRSGSARSVAGLLGLLGIEADPVKSREHILLSSILDAAWRAGAEPDLAALIRAGAEAALRQGRRVRRRDLLPGQGAHRARDARSTACSPRPDSTPGSTATRSTCSACCTRPMASPASRSSRSRT